VLAAYRQESQGSWSSRSRWWKRGSRGSGSGGHSESHAEVATTGASSSGAGVAGGSKCPPFILHEGGMIRWAN